MEIFYVCLKGKQRLVIQKKFSKKPLENDMFPPSLGKLVKNLIRFHIPKSLFKFVYMFFI